MSRVCMYVIIMMHERLKWGLMCKTKCMRLIKRKGLNYSLKYHILLPCYTFSSHIVTLLQQFVFLTSYAYT
jgi:hypothetical protein